MVSSLRVWVDHEMCVGNGACLRVAPLSFRHNDHRQSEVIEPVGDAVQVILDAAASCPVGAIHIETPTQERFFP